MTDPLVCSVLPYMIGEDDLRGVYYPPSHFACFIITKTLDGWQLLGLHADYVLGQFGKDQHIIQDYAEAAAMCAVLSVHDR